MCGGGGGVVAVCSPGTTGRHSNRRPDSDNSGLLLAYTEKEIIVKIFTRQARDDELPSYSCWRYTPDIIKSACMYGIPVRSIWCENHHSTLSLLLRYADIFFPCSFVPSSIELSVFHISVRCLSSLFSCYIPLPPPYCMTNISGEGGGGRGLQYLFSNTCTKYIPTHTCISLSVKLWSSPASCPPVIAGSCRLSACFSGSNWALHVLSLHRNNITFGATLYPAEAIFNNSSRTKFVKCSQMYNTMYGRVGGRAGGHTPRS